MAKLDGMRYPTKLSAEDAVDVAKIIVDEFSGEASSKEMFAQALGHSTAKSGSYITKVADARTYGVLPTQGLKATDLAHRLAHPKDRQEKRDAIFEMYHNIELLGRLYDQLDGNEPPSNLWSILVEITDASRPDAKEAADDIRQLYQAMLEWEDKSEEGSDTKAQSTEEDDPHQDSDSSEVDVDLNREDETEIYLKVGGDEHKFAEVTDLNIEIAIKILESKKSEDSGQGDGLVQARFDA